MIPLTTVQLCVEILHCPNADQGLYCVEQVQQKNEVRRYHSDGICNCGDVIVGLTISEERVVGFKVASALDASYVRDAGKRGATAQAAPRRSTRHNRGRR